MSPFWRPARLMLGCLVTLGCAHLKPGTKFRQCECPEGDICNTGQPPPFCRPAHASALGEPCSDRDNCTLGLECNFGFPRGRCEPPGSHREGEPCGSPSDCVDGLSCSNEFHDGRCVAPGRREAVKALKELYRE